MLWSELSYVRRAHRGAWWHVCIRETFTYIVFLTGRGIPLLQWILELYINGCRMITAGPLHNGDPDMVWRFWYLPNGAGYSIRYMFVTRTLTFQIIFSRSRIIIIQHRWHDFDALHIIQFHEPRKTCVSEFVRVILTSALFLEISLIKWMSMIIFCMCLW